MPMRALVVLLVVLNLGIAAWWMSRPSPAAVGVPPQPEGVPRLRLLGEGAGPVAQSRRAAPADVAETAADASAGADVAADAATAGNAADAPATAAQPDAVDANAIAAAAADTAPAPPAAAEAPRCFTAGPFADAAARDAARSALAARGATALVARDTTEAARGWRVAIAPQADRPAAEALADRIRAAGIDDYMIVPAGSADANGIALGRYGSERAARAREAALRGAGFADATAQPVGDATPRLWLDLQAGPGVDLAGGGVTLATRRCAGA